MVTSMTAGWKTMAAAATIAQMGRFRSAYAASAASPMSARAAGDRIRARIIGSDASVTVLNAGSIAARMPQM